MITPLLASVDPATTAETSNQLLVIAGQFGIKPHLLAAQLINFLLVAWALWGLVLKPIQKTLDARAKTIDEGLLKSEEATQTLHKAQGTSEEIITKAQKRAAEILAEAQKQAATLESTARTASAKETAAMLEAARAASAAEYAQSLQKSQDKLAGIVVSLAEKALGEELTPEQRARFAQRAEATFKK